MPIVTSTHTVGHPQRDERRYVVESHIDDAGASYVAEYLANDGADYAAIRDARRSVIDALLADAEANNLLGG